MDDNNIVSRYELCKKLSEATKVTAQHVGAVVAFLINEMERELVNGKKIEIINFGVLELRRMKPKKQHNVNTRKMIVVNRAKKLKLVLDRKISKYISNLLNESDLNG